MVREVVAILIAGAAVASLASDVSAQSPVQTQQESNVTSSGASLIGIQSRSIAKDFSIRSRTSLPSLRSNGTKQTSGIDGLTGILGNVGKRLEFGGVNDKPIDPQRTGSPFLSDVANGDSPNGGVKVRYRLNDK